MRKSPYSAGEIYEGCDHDPCALFDRIRVNGGPRGFDEETFYAKWIVEGVVGSASGAEAIAALESHIDAIYAVTRGHLSGTNLATIDECYIRRTQIRNSMRSEYLDDEEEDQEAGDNRDMNAEGNVGGVDAAASSNNTATWEPDAALGKIVALALSDSDPSAQANCTPAPLLPSRPLTHAELWRLLFHIGQLPQSPAQSSPTTPPFPPFLTA